MSGLALPCLVYREDRLVDFRDHAVGVLEEHRARLRQLDAATGSLEEFDAELLLQLSDLLAEGGFRNMFTLGRAPEV